RGCGRQSPQGIPDPGHQRRSKGDRQQNRQLTCANAHVKSPIGRIVQRVEPRMVGERVSHVRVVIARPPIATAPAGSKSSKVGECWNSKAQSSVCVLTTRGLSGTEFKSGSLEDPKTANECPRAYPRRRSR